MLRQTQDRQGIHCPPFPSIFHPFSTHSPNHFPPIKYTQRGFQLEQAKRAKLKTRSARQTTKPEKWAGRRQIFRLELYTRASNEKLK